MTSGYSTAGETLHQEADYAPSESADNKPESHLKEYLAQISASIGDALNLCPVSKSMINSVSDEMERFAQAHSGSLTQGQKDILQEIQIHFTETSRKVIEGQPVSENVIFALQEAVNNLSTDIMNNAGQRRQEGFVQEKARGASV